MKIFCSAVILTFFTFALTLSTFAQDDSRASITWQVQKYDITATLPQTETDRNLTVKATLNLKNVSSSAASTLSLRISANATVSAVSVNGATVDFSKREEKINANSSFQKIVVRVPSTPANQIISAAIDYKLNVKENSGLNALSPVGSQFLPLAFWYPTPNSWYFARGADYAPFSLKVSSANNLTVLSSGVENGGGFEQKLNDSLFLSRVIGTNLRRTEFRCLCRKERMQKRRNAHRNWRVWLRRRKLIRRICLEMRPMCRLKFIAVKRGAGFSGGGTIFVDDSIFRRQKIDSQTAMTIAEAVAKVWLGNAVQVDGDAYGVIREGLTKYIATQFWNQNTEKMSPILNDCGNARLTREFQKRDAPITIASPLDDYYYTEVANKGAMIWRILAKKVGQDEFFSVLKTNMKGGNLQLSELRSAFSSQKELLDYLFGQVTNTNLLVGLPQVNGAETKVALLNTGSIDAAVNVSATTATGEKLLTQTIIPAKSFGEVTFKSPNKIVRTEVDTDKLYPQTEYFR